MLYVMEAFLRDVLFSPLLDSCKFSWLSLVASNVNLESTSAW